MLITLMEEETLSSFAIRSLHVAGSIDIAKISKPLFQNGKNEWTLFPKVNKELLRVYENVFETQSLESVIRNHTLAPIYSSTSYFIERILRNNLKNADLVTHKKYIEVLSIAEVLTASIKFCPLCFAEQVTEFGFTWFKREWQIHSIGACLKHRCRLISRCSCGKTPKKVAETIALMRGRCDRCGLSIWTVWDNDLENDFPHWLTNLFDADLKPFSSNLKRFLLLESARRLQSRNVENLSAPRFLAQLYDPYNIDRSNRWRPKTLRKHRCYQHQLQELFLSSGPIPYTALLHPLSLAFPKFIDFTNFLKNVSYLNLKDPSWPELDLNPELVTIECAPISSQSRRLIKSFRSYGKRLK